MEKVISSIINIVRLAQHCSDPLGLRTLTTNNVYGETYAGFCTAILVLIDATFSFCNILLNINWILPLWMKQITENMWKLNLTESDHADCTGKNQNTINSGLQSAPD